MNAIKTKAKTAKHPEMERVHEVTVFDFEYGNVSIQYDGKGDYKWFRVNANKFRCAPKGAVIQVDPRRRRYLKYLKPEDDLFHDALALVGTGGRFQIMPYRKCLNRKIIGIIAGVEYWPGLLQD